MVLESWVGADFREELEKVKEQQSGQKMQT